MSRERNMILGQGDCVVYVFLVCPGPSWHAFVFYKVLSHNIYYTIKYYLLYFIGEEVEVIK